MTMKRSKYLRHEKRAYIVGSGSLAGSRGVDLPTEPDYLATSSGSKSIGQLFRLAADPYCFPFLAFSTLKPPQMGRPFLEFINDDIHIVLCKKCGTCLTGAKHLTSSDFVGASGRAALYNKVINVDLSGTIQRSMMTGVHIVRDVACKGCKTTIGWFYEFAYEPEQQYKEGKYVLEDTFLKKAPGIPDTKGGNPNCNL